MASQNPTHMNILYIAKNIPTPTRKANRVIFTLAEKLGENFSIDFLYPKEIVPVFLKNHQKYRHLKSLSSWTYNSFKIITTSYLRLPIKNFEFLFLPLTFSVPQHSTNYQLVHAHYLLPDGFMAYQIFKKKGIPYLVTIRDTDIQLIKKIKENGHTSKNIKKILENASQIIVLNSHAREIVLNRYGVQSKLIPSGIESKEILKQPPEYDEDKLIVTTVGSLIRRKQINWVINAFIQLHKEFSNIFLRIIGEGPEFDKLNILAEEAREAIEFTGQVPKPLVLDFLKESEIFLLPSIRETYGLVFNEAAANHNAMIGLHLEGPCGTYEEDNEMLFAINFEDFYQKLKLLIENPRKRKSLADNALKKVHNLTWENIIQKYHELYKSAH